MSAAIIQQETESDYMNEFKTYHPIVNFIYFVAVIGFSCFLMHPVCLLVSFVCGFVYSGILKGKKALKTSTVYMLMLMLAAALINPVFNHEGVTIIEYLPGGNPLTLESVIYGFSAAVMLVSVISWFSCYNAVMTSDKFIYLFGKIIPSLSLILSMTLRFVPKFTAQLKVVANAQKCLGRDVSKGSLVKRARYGLSILSIMVTWALENSIETADSMKSRGYGISGRTAFSIFTFDKRDRDTLICIAGFVIYVLAGIISGEISFRYFPAIKGNGINPFGISIFIAYTGLCMLPIIIEFLEVRKWKSIKSKI